MQGRQALLKDRNALSQQDQKLAVLAARNKSQSFHPNSNAVSDLERQFYIQKRQAEAVMGQSQKHRQKHIQKFQRRISQ